MPTADVLTRLLDQFDDQQFEALQQMAEAAPAGAQEPQEGAEPPPEGGGEEGSESAAQEAAESPEQQAQEAAEGTEQHSSQSWADHALEVGEQVDQLLTQIEDLADIAKETDGDAKAVKKAIKEAIKIQKECAKLCKDAEKAAKKENVGDAAYAAAECEELATEMAELLAATQEVATGDEVPEVEEPEDEESAPPPKAGGKGNAAKLWADKALG